MSSVERATTVTPWSEQSFEDAIRSGVARARRFATPGARG